MKLFLFSGLIFFSFASLAAGKNLIVCENPDVPNRLVIHQNTSGQLIALYSAELNWSGGLTTIPFKVEYIPATSGQAGIDYAGKDLSLHININESKNTFIGFFSIHSMEIENEKIQCRTIRRY